jgi:hypothetical protein
MKNGAMEYGSDGVLESSLGGSLRKASTPLFHWPIGFENFGGLTVFNRGSRRESKER